MWPVATIPCESQSWELMGCRQHRWPQPQSALHAGGGCASAQSFARAAKKGAAWTSSTFGPQTEARRWGANGAANMTSSTIDRGFGSQQGCAKSKTHWPVMCG